MARNYGGEGGANNRIIIMGEEMLEFSGWNLFKPYLSLQGSKSSDSKTR